MAYQIWHLRKSEGMSVFLSWMLRPIQSEIPWNASLGPPDITVWTLRGFQGWQCWAEMKERCADCLMFVYNPHRIVNGILFFLYESALIWGFVSESLDLSTVGYRCICQEMRGFDHSVYKESVDDWLSNLKVWLTCGGEIMQTWIGVVYLAWVTYFRFSTLVS